MPRITRRPTINGLQPEEIWRSTALAPTWTQLLLCRRVPAHYILLAFEVNYADGSAMARLSETMRKLARRRLEARLAVLRDLPPSLHATPVGGWVRAIREAQGMSRRVLAERMRVSESRVAEIETGEATGRLTVNALVRAASALDCRLLVALVPRAPIDEVATQARD